jgi:catechol 2,3-dioxygenase-like lactoylglutathione lyase family enzyme
MPNPQVHSTVPVIITDDIEKSLSYYRDVLGFSVDFRYGNPPVYAGINSGNQKYILRTIQNLYSC